MAKLNFNKRKYGKFATCLNKTIGFFARKATFEFLTEKPDDLALFYATIRRFRRRSHTNFFTETN